MDSEKGEATQPAKMDGVANDHKDDAGVSSDNEVSGVTTPPNRRSRSFSISEGNHRIVLMAVDSSEDAKFAFEWFLENIHKPNDAIILIHCPEAPSLPSFSFKSPISPPVNEWKKIMDDMNDRTRKIEEDYEQTCIHEKIRYKLRVEALKNPGEGIIKVAEEEMAELIVMGSRGGGKVKRALVGSVSDYVVRNAMLPVVLVPSIKKQEKRRKSQIQALAAHSHDQ